MQITKPKGLTPIRVATWLATYQDSDIVGKTHEPLSCPLAQVLKGINATDYASVTGRTYKIGMGYGESVYRDTPIWAWRFVMFVDMLHSRVVQSPVSADEAKGVLIESLQCCGHRDTERVRQILGL